jgi:hypothetical protein
LGGLFWFFPPLILKFLSEGKMTSESGLWITIGGNVFAEKMRYAIETRDPEGAF